MKCRLPILLVILCILCSQLLAAKGIIQIDSLDSLLINLKNPKDKVDAILKLYALGGLALYGLADKILSDAFRDKNQNKHEPDNVKSD